MPASDTGRKQQAGAVQEDSVFPPLAYSAAVILRDAVKINHRNCLTLNGNRFR